MTGRKKKKRRKRTLSECVYLFNLITSRSPDNRCLVRVTLSSASSSLLELWGRILAFPEVAESGDRKWSDAQGNE